MISSLNDSNKNWNLGLKLDPPILDLMGIYAGLGVGFLDLGLSIDKEEMQDSVSRCSKCPNCPRIVCCCGLSVSHCGGG